MHPQSFRYLLGLRSPEGFAPLSTGATTPWVIPSRCACGTNGRLTAVDGVSYAWSANPHPLRFWGQAGTCCRTAPARTPTTTRIDWPASFRAKTLIPTPTTASAIVYPRRSTARRRITCRGEKPVGGKNYIRTVFRWNLTL